MGSAHHSASSKPKTTSYLIGQNPHDLLHLQVAQPLQENTMAAL